MTVNLTLETETRLRQKAEREGQDVNVVADALLTTALEREAEEYTDMLRGIRRLRRGTFILSQSSPLKCAPDTTFRQFILLKF